MRLNVLATNGGKHSDSKLAYAMAADLVEDASNVTRQDAADMRKLENKIGDLLADHFKKIADRENAALADKGHEHLAASLDAHPEHAVEIEAAVLDTYKASTFWPAVGEMYNGPLNTSSRSVFAPETREDIIRRNVHEVVHKWMKVAQHMHRDWFAGSGKIGHGTALTDHPDWDPNNEHVQRWRDLHNAPTPERYRRALHEHATGEKLPPL